jgi:subtilisin family serine protease
MSKRTDPHFGEQVRKLHPKLRLLCNCSGPVNAVRAEQSGSVAVSAELARSAPVRTAAIVAEARPRKRWKRGHQKQPPKGVYVNVFVQTGKSAAFLKAKARIKSRSNGIGIATMPLAALDSLVADENVTFVEIGEGLSAPSPVAGTDAHPSAPPTPHFAMARRHRGGEGVLIGFIDVEGFDFSHPEFLRQDGTTRWVTIWDQGGDARPHPRGRGMKAFDYGAEFRQEHLNAALRTAPGLKVDAIDVEPQSQQVPGSHGTHVAGIAAGKHGVCPKAAIAGVLIALDAQDTDRRRSFYDSTRIVDAVEYLFEVARRLGEKEGKDPWPISVNISLGTNGHAHDGSAACCRWIDAALAMPGRSVCVAAGNSGQDMPEFEGDIGYVMGRIHTSGRIPARDLNKDIELLVIGNGKADVSENELEIWYGPQDRFAVSLRPPGGSWIGPVEPQQFLENVQLDDGSFFSIYNELYHPANGANYIAMYLSPLFAPDHIVGVKAGAWTIRLHGREVRDGRFDGWIERDDPGHLGRIGDREMWRFPSFFAQRSNVDQTSVSSLACALRTVAVANLDEVRERINVSSSQGPTRDGRSKPDVAAPGTDIVAANGFAGPAERWLSLSGTSMASPYVAGVVGLMLAIEPTLTAAQINGILMRTARPLPGADFAWANDAGFGRISPDDALREAAQVNQRQDLKP